MYAGNFHNSQQVNKRVQSGQTRKSNQANQNNNAYLKTEGS